VFRAAFSQVFSDRFLLEVFVLKNAREKTDGVFCSDAKGGWRLLLHVFSIIFQSVFWNPLRSKNILELK
jgi:hypothetical protein